MQGGTGLLRSGSQHLQWGTGLLRCWKKPLHGDARRMQRREAVLQPGQKQ